MRPEPFEENLRSAGVVKKRGALGSVSGPLSPAACGGIAPEALEDEPPSCTGSSTVEISCSSDPGGGAAIDFAAVMRDDLVVDAPSPVTASGTVSTSSPAPSSPSGVLACSPAVGSAEALTRPSLGCLPLRFVPARVCATAHLHSVGQ